MMVLHGLQVLYFALLEMRISFIPTSLSHHHLIVCTRHVILSIIIRVMRILLSIPIIVVVIVHVTLMLMHVLILMSKVLLLLLHRLSDNSLSVEVHGQVLETFDFEL